MLEHVDAHQTIKTATHLAIIANFHGHPVLELELGQSFIGQALLFRAERDTQAGKLREMSCC